MKKIAATLICAFALAQAYSAEGKSLQEIADSAAARGEKLVKISGFYELKEPLKLDERHSGIVFDGGGSAVLCRGERVQGWTFDGKYWRAKTRSGDVSSMFINGARAFPSAGEFKYMYAQYEKNPCFAFIARAEDFDYSPEELKNACIDICSVWLNFRMSAVSAEKIGDGKKLLVKLGGENRTPFFFCEPFPYYRVCNTLKNLRRAGEFYFDKSSREIFYLPREGEDMRSARVYVPSGEAALEIAGKSPKLRAENIEIRGFDFFCGGVKPFIQGKQAARAAGAFVNISNARGVVFARNKVRSTDAYGLSIGLASDNVRVEGSEFFDLGCGGIKIGPDEKNAGAAELDTFAVKVRDNIVRSYGRFNKAAVGIIVFDAREVEIDHNTIFDGFYTAVSCGWTWGYAPTRTRANKITNNRIFDIGQGYLSDMAGIYTLGSHKDSVISGNEISGVNRHRYGGWGIYNDEGSGDFLVEKNCVRGVQDDGYFQHYGIRNTVRNNVFENNGAGESQIGLGRRGKEYPDELVFERNIVAYKTPSKVLKKKPIERQNGKLDFNIYWAGGSAPDFGSMNIEMWRGKFGQDKNSIVEDPRLKDGVPTNADALRKIGFEIFDTKNAGVRGEMKARLAEILKSYKSPEVFRLAERPSWPREFELDLSGIPLGGRMRDKREVGSVNNGYDICVLEEARKRFLRFFDSKLPERTYNPTLNISHHSFIEGMKCRLEFSVRVYRYSTFFVECRGDTGHEGPVLHFKNGKPIVGGKAVEVPLGKWIDCSIEFAIDGSRNFKIEIRDGEKILAQSSRTYGAKPMSQTQAIVVAQTSNAEGAYFDIRGLSLKSAKQAK